MKFKFPLLLLLALFLQQAGLAQPKLVVGIVVDQMRYDYLYRYQSKYGPGGFKRLLTRVFLRQYALQLYADLHGPWPRPRSTPGPRLR